MKLLQEAMASSSTEALMDKVSQALSAQNIYADIWPTGKDSFAVYISWGDWKHDHLHAELIIEETLKGIDFSIEKEITEEDGSDTYSAIHNVTVYPPKANLDELEESALGTAINQNEERNRAEGRHNIRTAKFVVTKSEDDEGNKYADIINKEDTGKTRTNDSIKRFRGGGVIKNGTIYDDKGQELGKGFISSEKRTSKVFKPAGIERYVQLPDKNSKTTEKDESKMNQHSNTTVTESTIGKVDTAVVGIVNEKFTDNSAKVDTNLVTELKEKIKEFESRGFEDEDLQIQVDGNHIWFLGELSYRTQAKLADELNIILQKYDKDAYFDAEDSGRWFAIVNEPALTEDVQEEQPKAYIHFKDRRKGEIVKIVAEAGLSDILVIENDKVYGDDETLYKLAQFITPMSDEEKLEIVKENLRALRERKESYKGWNVGDKIKIIDMAGEPEYSGKEGIILFIDDIGQLHGTWGGLAVNLDVDQIKLLSSIADTEELTETFKNEELITVYNGSNDLIDYNNIDFTKSEEIGLHCGSKKAAESKGKNIKELKIDTSNCYKMNTDLTDMWASPRILNYMDFLSEEQLEKIKNEMRAVSGDLDKYNKYSAIIRDAFLNNGYKCISYPNEIEDPGHISYIVLDNSIIDKNKELEESFGDADIEKCKFEITIIPNENANLDVFNKLTHHMDYLVDINESKYTFWDVNVDITDNLIKVTGTIEGHGCQHLEEHINTEGWPEINSIEVNVYKENIEESLEENTETTPAAVTPGPDSGIASVLNGLIIDE